MNLLLIVALVAARPTEEEIRTAFTQAKAEHQAKIDKLEAGIPRMSPAEKQDALEFLAQLRKLKTVRPKAAQENGNIGFLCGRVGDFDTDSLRFVKSLGKNQSRVRVIGGRGFPSGVWWPGKEQDGILAGYDNSKWKPGEYLEGGQFLVFVDRYQAARPRYRPSTSSITTRMVRPPRRHRYGSTEYPVWTRLDLTPEQWKLLELK